MFFTMSLQLQVEICKVSLAELKGEALHMDCKDMSLSIYEQTCWHNLLSEVILDHSDVPSQSQSNYRPR